MELSVIFLRVGDSGLFCGIGDSTMESIVDYGLIRLIALFYGLRLEQGLRRLIGACFQINHARKFSTTGEDLSSCLSHYVSLLSL